MIILIFIQRLSVSSSLVITFCCCVEFSDQSHGFLRERIASILEKKNSDTMVTNVEILKFNFNNGNNIDTTGRKQINT